MELKVTQEKLFTNHDLMRLLLPLFIEQFLAIAVGLADQIMVAYVGESAVSAVSLVDSINILIINIFAALATGGAVVAGQFIGQKNYDLANQAGFQLFLLVGIISLGVTGLMYAMRHFILTVVFGKIEADVATYAWTYMNITFASVPFIALYNAGAAIFRSMRDSRTTMIVSIITNLINVSGNAIGVFVLQLGISGVAYPTLISRMAGAFIIIALLFDQRKLIHLSRRLSFRFNRYIVRNILKIGIPNGIENSMFQLGKILLLSVISAFGTAAITANAIGNTVSAFAILPGVAIGLGLVTIVSQCVGAGNYDDARLYTKKLIFLVIISHLFVNGLLVLALPLIITIYHLSTETAVLTRQVIIFHSIFAATIWPLAFTLPNTLRAANDVRFAMGVSVFSMWVFRIGLGIYLAKYTALGMISIWIAMIADWIVRSIFFILRFHGKRWEKHRPQPPILS